MREQFVAAGIDEPTLTPEQVIAPRDRSALVPPDMASDTTLYAGAGAPFGPAGSVSARSSVSPLVIGSGPLLVTATVQVILPPALTGEGLAVFVRARSYWHGSQSMSSWPFAPATVPVAVVVPAEPVMPEGTGAPTVGEVAATQLDPPPPPPPVTLSTVVADPPPAPVYPAPPPPPES